MRGRGSGRGPKQKQSEATRQFGNIHAIGSNNVRVSFDRIILSIVFVMGSIYMLRSVGRKSKKSPDRRREREIGEIERERIT